MFNKASLRPSLHLWIGMLTAIVLVVFAPQPLNAVPPTQDQQVYISDQARQLAEAHQMQPELVQAMLDAGVPPQYITPELEATFRSEIQPELSDQISTPDVGMQASVPPAPSAESAVTAGPVAALVTCSSQNFPLVFLSVSVSENGTPLTNLTRQNFSCTENGVAQNDLFSVTPPDTSGGVRLADIVFLIDTSSSMGGEIAAVRQNAAAFAGALASSNIDFRLGLVKFGNSSGANPFLFDGGNLTSDIKQFQANLATLVASGGFEPGFLALRMAVQGFNFRPGAQKVFILITDEDSDDLDKQSTVALLLANNVVVHAAAQCTFGSSNAHYCDSSSVRAATSGLLFDVVGPYEKILSTIVEQTAQTYVLRYRSSNQKYDGTTRNVSCTVTIPSGASSVACAYIPGAAPKIVRTADTIALDKTPIVEGAGPSVKVTVTDSVAPFVKTVSLYYRTTGASIYSSLPMVAVGGDIYSAAIPAVKAPGVDYYIRATDGDVTSQLPSTDPANEPFQIAVLPNVAPSISHTPVSSAQRNADVQVAADVSDSTNRVVSVDLFWRRFGELLYNKLPMTASGVRYTANIPADQVTADMQYYIVAVDDLKLSSTSGTKDAPHFVGIVQPISKTNRDIVFIKGIDSNGDCGGANTWMKEYLSSTSNNPFLAGIKIGKYLNFSYFNESDLPGLSEYFYTCPLPDLPPLGQFPAYNALSTCDGVAKAAGELKAAIDKHASNPVTVFAHSMGGLVTAYMVAADPDWAKTHIASVMTFDSPLQGVFGPKTWVKQLVSVCRLDQNDLPVELLNVQQSLLDLQDTSEAVQKARTAATIVPFYPLDATSWVEGRLVVSRDSSRLDNSKPFHLFNSCYGWGRTNDNCEPPLSVRDNHGEAWDRRKDGNDVDKASLGGCAVAGALDCTVLSAASVNTVQASSGSGQTEEPIKQLPITIQSGNRVRFVVTFAGPVRMTMQAPSGATYGYNASGPVAGYEAGEGYEAYEIEDPELGQWLVTLIGADVLSNPSSISVAALSFGTVSGASNIGPIASAGGPYSALTGEPIVFNGNLSYDADGLVTLFEWDFNQDGVFEVSSSDTRVTQTFTAPFTGAVTVRVTDSGGITATAASTVSVSLRPLYLPYIQDGGIAAASPAIAFISDRNGNTDIYRVNTDGSQLQQLTTDPGRDELPTWSPDGSQIVFHSTRGGYFQLYVMNADGTNQRRLVTSNAIDESAYWSPAGDKIAFSRVADHDRNGSVHTEVFVVNADGSDARRITFTTGKTGTYGHGCWPSGWTRDGAKLLTYCYEGNNNMYMANADGSGRVPLVTNGRWNSIPTISPDGAKIAFSSYINSNQEILVLNLNTGVVTQVTSVKSEDWRPIWSPTGGQILFESDRSGTMQVYRMNVDGSNVQMVGAGAGKNSHASWRP